MAVEAGGTPRAHCPSAAGHGFQRSAGGPPAPYRKASAMSSADQPIERENLVAATIGAAEDIRDPLDGIVEKAATDPGAPFAPDVLERGRLRRAATFLRKIGIEIGFGREGQARIRTIHITTNHALPGLEQAGVLPSAPSVSPALPLNMNS